MLGISYGELLLLLGATAALIGPKDLPIIARTAGRLAGRAIGYVQLARGQFETVMQQSQARQVHKELQDTIAQLDAIRHEIRSISIMNPGPLTRRIVDNLDDTSNVIDAERQQKVDVKDNLGSNIIKDFGSTFSHPSNLHSQAATFARLAESLPVKDDQMENPNKTEKNDQEANHLTVLPISAENAGLLPNRKADFKGSDIILEAILEAEVAHSAKEFFLQPENQIRQEGDGQNCDGK